MLLDAFTSLHRSTIESIHSFFFFIIFIERILIVTYIFYQFYRVFFIHHASYINKFTVYSILKRATLFIYLYLYIKYVIHERKNLVHLPYKIINFYNNTVRTHSE